MPPRRAFFVSAGSVWSKTHCGCARFRPGLIGAYRRFVYPHCQRSEGIFLFAQYSPSCDHGLVKPVACIECSRGRNQTALVRTPLDGRGRTSSELLRCSPQRPVMETAGFGKAKTSAYDSVRSAATYLAGLSTIAASYIGLTWSALLVPAINPAATPLWPPTGFALALILLGGYRTWPAILAGPFLSHLLASQPLIECGSIAIGTLLGAFAGTWLIVRCSNGRQTFDTPSGIAKFAIISFAPTAMISSAIVLAGFLITNQPGSSDAIATWSTWWLADAAGSVVIVPVLVLWAMMPLRGSSRRSSWNWSRSLFSWPSSGSLLTVRLSAVILSAKISMSCRHIAAFLAS